MEKKIVQILYKSKSPYKSITRIFLLAFLVRLTAVILAVRYNFLQTWEYEAIADNILNGLGYRLEHLGTVHYAFGPPLYPLFAAMVYSITSHSQLALAATQAFLSAITCVFIFQISKEIFNPRTGLIASLIVALHPGLIIYVTKLHSFNIDVLLLSLMTLFLLKAKKKMTTIYFLLFGAVFGLCLLSRSTIFLFFPLIFILLLVTSNQKKKVTYYFMLSGAIALLVISPWMIRNYLILNRFIFVQKGGEVFWRGNNPMATGGSYTVDGNAMIQSAPKDFLNKIYASTEIEQDILFWNEGLKFIREHPLSFMRLTIKKFYYFWWFSPSTGIEYPRIYLLAYKALYSIALLFGILGITLALSSNLETLRQNTYVLLLLLLSVSFIHSLFYVEGRHRWAIEPLFIIFTANGFIYIKDRITRCLKTLA